MTAPVTVVVPVYGGLDDVRRCLESVVRHADGHEPFELRVIDDASPGPEVSRYLAEFEQRVGWAHLTIIQNQDNQGFVRTCNQALRGTAGDVVLLNSDTVVTAGWLDRLVAAARTPGVATVTPLTNFGSICTLPASVVEAFALAGEAPQIDECAAFVLDRSPGRLPAVITGVGFCMYITRAALDACGEFDDETFGLGYGEEVDFCLRAATVGFRHLVEDRTYVYHRGGGSFSDRRAEGLKRSSAILHRRYPYFRALNTQERRHDPLSLTFTALDLGLKQRDESRSHVLHLLHSKPGDLGGTEKHLLRLIDGLLPEIDVSILQPFPGGFLLTTVWSVDGDIVRGEHLLPGQARSREQIHDPLAAAALETVLDMFHFDAVHIQNIVHHSLAPLAVLADFDGPVSCSVRDLYLACPHHWLLYRNESACGIPGDLSYCARCLPEIRNLDVDHLETFRQTVADRLGVVDHWVFASQSAMDFFLRVYDVDPARMALIPHGTIIDQERAGRPVDEALIRHEPLRLAFVGLGWAKKGLPAVNELAEAFAPSTVEIHHFGELRDQISPAVHEHGGYDNNELPELLRRAGIHVVLLPGPFLETFGHVMTEALISGLPVIGNQSGALGERIRSAGVGWTVDADDVGTMYELIVNLDRCRDEVLATTRRAAAVHLVTVGETVEQYAALYRRPQTDGPPATRSRSMDDAERNRMQRQLQAMTAENRRLQVQLADATSRPQAAGEAASPGSGPSAGAGRWPPFVGRIRRSIEHRGLFGAVEAFNRKAAHKARRKFGR